MADVSVAEAADRLGVSVRRIHQRIADGSLKARRIGSQWVVDELSILRAAERAKRGRPLSERSAWALIAQAEGDEGALAGAAASERARAKSRLANLYALAEEAPVDEEDVKRIAAALRSLLQNRASREVYRAADRDLDDLRSDVRWVSMVSPAASGIASSEVDGYVSGEIAQQLKRDYLLSPVHGDGNVVIHVIDQGQKAYPDSKLRLAVDLAEQRGPREELRAAQLLWEIAREHSAPDEAVAVDGSFR